MIIDAILDRKDGIPYTENDVMYIFEMASMMDLHTLCRDLKRNNNMGAQRRLCDYIHDEGYNPEICDYIKSKNWVEADEPEKTSMDEAQIKHAYAMLVQVFDVSEKPRHTVIDTIVRIGVRETKEMLAAVLSAMYGDGRIGRKVNNYFEVTGRNNVTFDYMVIHPAHLNEIATAFTEIETSMETKKGMYYVE